MSDRQNDNRRRGGLLSLVILAITFPIIFPFAVIGEGGDHVKKIGAIDDGFLYLVITNLRNMAKKNFQ